MQTCHEEIEPIRIMLCRLLPIFNRLIKKEEVFNSVVFLCLFFMFLLRHLIESGVSFFKNNDGLYKMPTKIATSTGCYVMCYELLRNGVAAATLFSDVNLMPFLILNVFFSYFSIIDGHLL